MKKHLALASFVTFLIYFSSCGTDVQKSSQTVPIDSAFIDSLVKYAPPLSPGDALRTMVVEEGFDVMLVASEPLVNSPIAMSFDNDGRLWVLEMTSFMPDVEGEGEKAPTSKIVILEDRDSDGDYDERKVFLDSLVLPRAMSFVGDGILVAEPPYLWYYDIEDDQPINKQLVDSAYASGENVEHQSNGLLRGLDNWIYNSNHDKRYRLVDGEWRVEKTHLRGQWGVTKDNYGHLYYNNNSQNLLGDYFFPSLGSNNNNLHRVAGYNERIVRNNRVFPIRQTTGINRGYQTGMLDSNLRLVNFTAASGPVIYRGDLLGEDFKNNAFVGEPSANLIKRNTLSREGNKVVGEQAYEGREFLASYDERFRPVTLYNGPDGALYVVDMYRGILQHKLYITEYLRKEINQRDLDAPITYGRIYKIIPEGSKPSPVKISHKPKDLLKLLGHANGWARDRAQQLIVDRRLMQLVPDLKENVKEASDPLLRIHSLWTLEGLGALEPEDVMTLLESDDWNLREQALVVMRAVVNRDNYQEFLSIQQEMIENRDSLAAPYIAFQSYLFDDLDQSATEQLRVDLVKAFPGNNYVSDAVISNLEGVEQEFQTKLIDNQVDTSRHIQKRLASVLRDIEKNKNRPAVNPLVSRYPRGAALFKNTCQTCHGEDGEGIDLLAPPLNNSEWVTGDKDRLITLVLYGLSGPIEVNGQKYEDIVGQMPGIGSNRDIVDAEIAELLSFIRQSWNNDASTVSRPDIIKIRNKYGDRQKSFTAEELKNQ
ncbi:PVC-type heme-binding CxxCH protein [Albibacterium profundi]|uniref:PVC-type heme-binding CxxCH protein n=1 Tax=Albibacterium profundi TaxID=3134906 RepID=A0ABV5CA96_9SPHI